jgi:hypothetical protein
MNNKTIKAQNKNNDMLLEKQGVQGTAVGKKMINGRQTHDDAILIFVQKKYSPRSISSPNILTKFSVEDLIPDEIDGIPTDVIEVGNIKKQATSQKKGFRHPVRPLRPGFSVGHAQVTCGTIGGIFKDDKDRVVILSNNHVIANENNAKVGDLIYQPGKTDSKRSFKNKGWPEPVHKLPYIGTLDKFVKIKRNNNTQDSAIALIHPKLVEEDMLNLKYPLINKKLTGFEQPKVGMKVQKFGRTTGHTKGKVIGLNATFSIEYDFGMARFNKCVVLSAMSQGGDSGSIIQTMDNKAVGLLFAGSPRVTIANPIGLVKEHYNLKIY